MRKELTIQNLLLYKSIKPLSEENLNIIKNIESLDVKRFTEADVREEIINPILKILGYQKGKWSSVDREKNIKFLDKKDRYIDYSLTCWEEDFWIVEAKKPIKKDKFGYKELSQAIEYAINPNINASIVVLCDGVIFEVYDIDENIQEPLLKFNIINLSQNIDNLRKLLEPVQVWFFYKRKILRNIEKAFKHEFNQGRIIEFKELIDEKLDEYQRNIFENIRKLNIEPNDEYNNLLENADRDSIIDIHFFEDNQTLHQMKLMSDNLINFMDKNNNKFFIPYRIFSDNPQEANDYFHVNSLFFLLEVHSKNLSFNWLPSWLSSKSENSIEYAIQKLIRLSLNYFEEDLERRVILLVNNTYRRIYQILLISGEEAYNTAKDLHSYHRFNVEEFSWSQIASSPERSLLILRDSNTKIAIKRFIRNFTVNEEFNINLAQQHLQSLWKYEETLLKSIPNYKGLRKERKFDELQSIEFFSLNYDMLGHLVLCILEEYPIWKKYLLLEHQKEISVHTGLGSWAGKKLLEENKINKLIKISDNDIARRFFLGDLEQYLSLKKLYFT